MKWALAAAGIGAALGLGAWLRRAPDWALVLSALVVGFLPFVGLDHVSINPISFELYRGESRGLEVTALDLLALALWVALPTPTQRTPYAFPRALYLLAICISAVLATRPLFSLFSVWKLVRMYGFLVVVVRAAMIPRVAAAMTSGVGIGVLFSCALALGQRYSFGVTRPSGAFPHSNSLAMAANLALPIAFAIVLARPKTRLAAATALAAPVVVLLTLSRGAIVLTAVALATVLVGSLLRRPSRRKLGIAAIGALLGGAMLAKSWDTVVARFSSAPSQSEEARLLFNQAARAMLSDHPFGIGINQYSWVLETAGYADRVGLAEIDRSGIAHHIYWLTAAETGYFGLLAYLLLLLAPLLLAIRIAVRVKGLRGDIALGCAVAFGVTAAQGTAEWIARQTAMSYLFWLVAGLVAALARPSVSRWGAPIVSSRERPSTKRIATAPRDGTAPALPLVDASLSVPGGPDALALVPVVPGIAAGHSGSER